MLPAGGYRPGGWSCGRCATCGAVLAADTAGPRLHRDTFDMTEEGGDVWADYWRKGRTATWLASQSRLQGVYSSRIDGLPGGRAVYFGAYTVCDVPGMQQPSYTVVQVQVPIGLGRGSKLLQLEVPAQNLEELKRALSGVAPQRIAGPATT
jgi:hypothetical protein